MRSYVSFIIRCWTYGDAAHVEHSIVDVEHVQSGEHFVLKSLDEAHEQMADTYGESRRLLAAQAACSPEGEE